MVTTDEGALCIIHFADRSNSMSKLHGCCEAHVGLGLSRRKRCAAAYSTANRKRRARWSELKRGLVSRFARSEVIKVALWPAATSGLTTP